MKMSLRNRIECPKYHQLVAKRGAKSNIWQFYGLPGNESGKIINENISICQMCKYPVSSKGGSTSNLRGHLKLHHPLQYQSLQSCNVQENVSQHDTVHDTDDDNDHPKAALQNPLAESHFEKTSSQSHDHTSQQQQKNKQKSLMDYAPLDARSAKKCTVSIAKFLANGMHPYSMVEEESFKEMVNALNSRYCIPGRKHFSNTAIPNLYNEAVDKLKELLRKDSSVKSYFSLTCDCWTSVAGHPYIAITIHFINSSWVLVPACLSCTFFEENHTAENIKDVIQNKLVEWDLDPNLVVSCTTDNAANMVNSMKLLNINHIPCFAHCTNIGVNCALEVPQVKRAVAKLKALQNVIAHSWKMKRDLKDAQELLQCETKNLPSACPTRWWSTLRLCKRFLENQLPICKMLQNFTDKKHLMLEGSYVSVLENFVEVVSVLQDITENLTSENYVTSSAVLPLIRQIKKNLQRKDSDTVLLKTLKEKVLNALTRYESTENNALHTMLCHSTFIDPRFRLYFFDENVKVDVKVGVINELLSLPEPLIMQPQTNLEPPTAKKKKRGLAALLEEEYESSDHTQEPKQKCIDEVERYLSMPKIGLDDNPLKWWQYHAPSFPKLSIIAKKYLCIQGSSVPSERVFSTGGNVINKRRCSLLPKNAEMQIFLSCNKNVLRI